MASFTIITTPEQDAGIVRAVRRANDEIERRNAANPGLPPLPQWTPRDYLRARVTTILDAWAEEADSTQREQLREAWQDPVKRDAIKLAAGIV